MVTVLWALEPTSGLSLRELAAQLHYDPSNVALLAQRLEAMGLVDKTPDPSDGRRRVLTLSARGTEIYLSLLHRLYSTSAFFPSTLTERATAADRPTRQGPPVPRRGASRKSWAGQLT